MDVEEGRDGRGTCTCGGKEGKGEDGYCAWVEEMTHWTNGLLVNAKFIWFC